MNIFAVFVFALVYKDVLLTEAGSLSKRQNCLGGGCGIPCSDDLCGEERVPCGGGGCPQTDNLRIRTCSSCINQCSQRCSSYTCLNACLTACNCDSQNLDATDECCDVLHPKVCFTDETGRKRCIIRRHRECSDLCTSSVVSIQERDNDGKIGCHYIRNFPYVYCGNYERQNCGQCYTCDGSYNPKTCSSRSECTENCRSAIPSISPILV